MSSGLISKLASSGSASSANVLMITDDSVLLYQGNAVLAAYIE